MKITATWQEKMHFLGVNEKGKKVIFDANKEHGGIDAGPTPKELVLMGLAGCTGMDVISILNKMRQPVKSFNIEVSGELTKTDPLVFKKIHIKYILTGDLDKEKAEKAVKLSQESYCSVSAMLRKTAKITTEIVLA